MYITFKVINPDITNISLLNFFNIAVHPDPDYVCSFMRLKE